MRKIKKFQKSGSEKELWDIIAGISNPKEISIFMNDILTPNEKSMLTQRWVIAKLFNKNWTYEMIYEKIGAGMSTINRVFNVFHRGTGGYKIALDYINQQKESSQINNKKFEKSNLENYIDRRLKKGK